MADYSMSDILGMINKYKDSNPALAYAIYNGVSGIGGNGSLDPGALTIALRNAWGEQAAQDFVNQGTKKYGNTSLDPTTGDWGGMGEAAGLGGHLADWNPAAFNRDMKFDGAYNPPGGANTTSTFPGAAPGTPPAPKTTTTPPAAGGRTPFQPPGSMGTPGTGPAGGPIQTPIGQILQQYLAQMKNNPNQMFRQQRTQTNPYAGPQGGAGGPGIGGLYPNIAAQAGKTPYTYTGLPMRAFDPSQMIQAMRQHFGSGGGAGQTFTPTMNPNDRQNNLSIWDSIFSRG